MKTDNKNSFILYTEYIDCMKMLSNEDAGILIKGIFDYCANETEPELEGQAKLAFGFIKPSLDRNAEKYKQRCETSRVNGLKGGRPKQQEEVEEVSEAEENLKNQKVIFKTQNNPTVFSKTQKNQRLFLKTLNDSESDSESESDSSLSQKRERIHKERERKLTKNERETKITEEEREILEKYVRKNKLADKNINAYVRSIIKNGDHRSILSEEREKTKPPDDYSKIIAGITDKKSAYSALAKFCYGLDYSPPDEFREVIEKYDFGTYEKLDEYYKMLCKEHYGY